MPGNPTVIVNILHVAAEYDWEECNLLRFWQIEVTEISPDVVRNPDQQFLNSYSESQILRQDDRTYCAGFPWRAEHHPVPDNFNVCQKCTQFLAHELAQSPDLLEIYNGILLEQLKRGFMSL